MTRCRVKSTGERQTIGAETGPARDLTARTVRGLAWSYGGLAAKGALSLLVLATLSRLLTPQDFGIIGIAFIFVFFAHSLCLTGIGHALIQVPEPTNRHAAAGLVLAIGTGALAAATLWSLAPLCARLFGEPLVSPPLRFMAASLVIAAAGVVSEHAIRRKLLFRQLAIIELLSYTAYGAIAITLAFGGTGVWALAWAEIGRASVRAAMALFRSPPPVGYRPGAREVVDIASRAAVMAVGQLADTIVRMAGHFVVGRELGAVALGYYARAERIATLPFDYIGSGLFEVAFPAMARRRERPDRLRTAYGHAIEALALLTVPVAVLTVAAAPEIVGVLLGSQWVRSIPVLQLLAIAIPFQTLNSLNIAALRALGLVRREARRRAAHALMIAVGAGVGQHWGLEGVAVGIVGAHIAASLLLTHAAANALGMHGRRVARHCTPGIWAAACVGLAAWLATGPARYLPLPLALAMLTTALTVAVAISMYAAPRFARLSIIAFVLERLPFNRMGAVGHGLRWALEKLPTRPLANGSGSNKSGTGDYPDGCR